MSDNDSVRKVEAIVGHRRKNGREEFLIKWKNTWEPESNLDEGSLKIAKAYRNGQEELQRAQKPQRRRLRLKRKRRQESHDSDDDFICDADDSFMSDGACHDQSVDDNPGAEKMHVTPSPKRPHRVCYAKTTSEQTRKTNEELSSDDDASFDKMIAKKRGARRKILEESDDSDTSSDNEDTNHGAKLPPLPLSTPPPSNLSSGPKKLKTTSIQCSSTIDALTKKRLPYPSRSPHVCFTNSDGDRYCYALDTLYRMALENHVAGQKLTFLQPPNFYEPMSEDLEDQIACRFGRQALKIENSKNYHRYYERFVLGLGRHDLYCCPICYNEASQSRGSSWIEDDDDDDEEENSDEEYEEDCCFAFEDDPMTILRKMGSSVASSFCFLKVKDVRMHMKDAHSIDLGELKGNGLFKRFMIRSPDGLLQHHTSDMRGYWRDGNNSDSFRNLVQLLQDNEGKNSTSIQSDFCTSFPKRARKIWEKVSGPYLKVNYTSLEEEQFINDDNNDDEDANEVMAIPFFDPSSSEEEEIEQYIEELKRRGEQSRSSENDASSSDENDSCEDSLEFEESDSEENEEEESDSEENEEEEEEESDSEEN
eukprot:CAMPEP_0201689048 /NCGR_PEP_ID=MMETSP0578-20130828/2712_1 /ASSEMBLY_ACC=CAM_ASM_000663 /TAXON_ID=267565 /ORGANISM="Skeletonema grethea, Strain CCMP 1804" /LENGTH=592 /DNA_ID=CAMNT_0048173565 /DNA_START=200 /DNA_END=1975 /DNA_ORIENTATION=-